MQSSDKKARFILLMRKQHMDYDALDPTLILLLTSLFLNSHRFQIGLGLLWLEWRGISSLLLEYQDNALCPCLRDGERMQGEEKRMSIITESTSYLGKSWVVRPVSVNTTRLSLISRHLMMLTSRRCAFKPAMMIPSRSQKGVGWLGYLLCHTTDPPQPLDQGIEAISIHRFLFFAHQVIGKTGMHPRKRQHQ